METEDSIEINGKLHTKPFVEKPISAEDHNVYIYFPQAAGGGSTRLFRKVRMSWILCSVFCSLHASLCQCLCIFVLVSALFF